MKHLLRFTPPAWLVPHPPRAMWLLTLLLLLVSHVSAWATNVIVPGITANTTTPVPGTNLVLTLTYTNNNTKGTDRTATLDRDGTSATNGIFGLPTGLTGVTFGGAGSSSATYNSGTGRISFSGTGTLNSGASNLNFTITIPVPVGGLASFTLTSAPTTTTTATTVNPASAKITIAPPLPADISVSIAAPASAPAGSQATITTTATNTNNANTATSVVVVVQLATGLAASDVSISNFGIYDAGSGKVTFPAQSLAPNETFVPIIRLRMPASGTRTAKATVTSDVDPIPANNTSTLATIAVTQIADLAIAVSGPIAATAGSSIVYAVQLSNQGPSTATGVAAQLTLTGAPTNVVVTGGSYAGGVVTLTVPGGTLASGGALGYTIRFTVPATGPVTGTALATSTTANGDPVAANNNGTAPASNISTAVVSSTPSEVCANPGASGSLIYTGAQGVNTYYPGTANAVAGQKVISIGTGVTSGSGTAALAVNDLVVVMQMQGAPFDYSNTSSYGDGYAGDPGSGNQGGSAFTAGQYEYGVVTAIGTGTITLQTNLTNAYQNANATATAGQRRFQVIRVPQYQNFTLNANLTTTPAWNGSTGGVLILDVAGTLSLGTNRTINLSGKGFRGGAGRGLAGAAGYLLTDYRTPATAAVNATKGEGIAGTPRYLNAGGTALTDLGASFGYPNGNAVGGGDNGRGAPGNAGGGGTDTSPDNNEENTGGGGGSNGGFGGQGGNGWQSNLPYGGFGGAPFLEVAPNRIILGGGGGAGTTNNATVADDATYPANAGLTNDGFASSGAPGGGIVVARAANVSGTGTIDVSGADMEYVPENDGSGGGGAGGSVLLISNNTAANALTGVTIVASGGQGGSNTGGGSAHGPGGGGSGGVAFASSPVNAASSYAAGTNGTTANGIVYEAGPGTSSATSVRTNVGFDETPLLQAGANCVADVTTTLSGPTTIAAGGNSGPYTATFTNNGLGVAAAVVRTVTLPTGASLTTAQKDDLNARYGLTNASYTTTGTGATAVTTISGPAASVSSGGSVSFTFSFTAPAASGTVTLNSNTSTSTNQGADLAPNTASLAITVTAGLTGTIFEDVNYGGGAGRDYAAANTSATASGFAAGAIGRPGVRVELYNTSTGAFVAAAITDANGQYSLPVAASTGYTVRVVNNSVTSARAGATFSGDATSGYMSSQLAVQTYNGTTDRVGGEYPGRTDAGANTTNANLSTLTGGGLAAQSLRTVTSAGSGASTGPNFGFSFDVISNTNDGGQGSVAQFVANASALGDEAKLAQSGSRLNAAGTTQALPTLKENSVFMIPNGATTGVPAGLRAYNAGTNPGLASQLTGGVALITSTSTLTLSGANAANTVLDGTTQGFNIGNSNTGTATNATATTVGTDGVTLAGVLQAEVEISGAGVVSVLDVETGSATVRGLALHGGTDQTILAGGSASATGYLFENLIVGATADGVRPSSNTSDNIGLYLGTQSGVGTTQNSLIAYTGNSGVGLHNGIATVGTTQLLSNFFVKNGFLSAGGDGLTLGDGGKPSGPANVAGNLFSNSNSSGLQFEIGSTAATTVTNNTVVNAGTIGGDAGAVTSNLEGAAIVYLSRTGAERGSQADVISKNVISSAQSAGIVVGYGQQNVTISQNNTNTNGGLGIDIIPVDKNVATGDGVYGDGDGVTLNDGNNPGAATADQPNKGLDFPILTSATIVGANLVVKGIARPGVTVELFLRDTDTGNFGEGQTYLGGGIENGTGDLNTATTTVNYSGTINGLNQGSDNSNTARNFTFSVPISSLSAAQLAALNANGLTATATLSGAGTSEFAGRVLPNNAPVANTVSNVTVATNSGPVALSPGLSGTATGTLSTGTVNAVATYTILTLPISGTLSYNNGVSIVPVAANTTITAAQLASLTYTPVSGYTGTSVSFTYNVTDGNGITSTTNNNGGSITAGAATYTIPLTSAADVTTTLNGPTQLSTGTTAGPYTVTFANVGLAAASTVTRKVTLPPGATLTTDQTTAITAQGGSVTGQVIDFGNVTSLAAGASSSFTFSFTAPATAGAVALTTNTTTTSSEGGNPAPNSSTINATVNAAADVVAIIMPITATVKAGATGVGFNVSFSNNGGLATAAGVTRTVQLPAGLTAYGVVAATNGGTYDNATGLVSYTPATTTIASGTPLTSVITFTAPPSGPVAATASVSTTSFEAGQTANNSASARVTVTPAFDLKTTIYGPTSVVEGNEVVLNVTTTNAGPSAVPNAVQTVQLLAGLTNVFVSNNGSYDSGTGLVNFPALASLPSGQTVANTISFRAPAAGTTLAPKATVTPNTTGTGDTNPANNDAFLNGAATSTNLTITAPTTGAKANAYATISASAQSVAAGTAVTLTVVTGNAGPGDASNLVGRVQLLPGLTLTAQPTGSTYDTNTGLLTLATVPTQAVGTSQMGTITFNAPTSVGNNGAMLFTASVSTATSETVLADNLSATLVTVTTTTDVATTIAGPATATAGQAVTFTASFANNGPGLASGVARTAQLPAGLSSVIVTDVATGTVVSGAYNATTGLVTLPTLTSQPAGSSAAYTLAFVAPATSFGVRSAISATSPDGTLTNNRSSASTTVSPAADVAVAISGPAVAVIGNPVTYNVTTTNNGPNAASGVATTLQLPMGLTGVTVSGTGSYVSSSGLVTFGAAGTLANGASMADFVTFTMPNATGGQLNGVASVTSTSTDPIAANNSASTATSIVLITPVTADLVTTVTIPATATANGSLSVTATFTNTGSTAALSVAPTLQLPAGLTVGTISNSGSYNAATGLVTWPIIASQANNATGNQSYTVALTAPGTGPLRATSAVTSQTSEATLTNNQFTATTTITAAFDAVTSLSGPATSLLGATNTYTLTATNNGPSTAPSATPSVTLPAGVTPTNISGGGTFSGTTITWPAISNQASGGATTYTFDAVMPTTGNLALTATVTASGESTTANNGSALTTTRANQPPVAYNVVNNLQAPRGNTANQLAVASLAATDADGTVATYQLTGTLPASAQGVLYYNNNNDGTSGSYVALPIGQNLTAAQAGTMRFDPAAGFVGNVFYTYTATDNLTAVGNVATYTVPVGQDNNSVYSATPSKGGINKYVDKNLLAYVVDPNGANYNSAGVFFDATTSARQTGTSNGLPATGTNAVLAASGNGPVQNPTNALPSGVNFDPATGNFFVDNTKGALPRITAATTYYFNVTTTDVYGGVNVVLAQFTLGAYPLPVELTFFTAKAMRNTDALLAWNTASEKNNDHFDVERSLNGTSYAKIGEVQGQGSKSSPTDYTLTDASAAQLGRLLYYRLRQVDADGTATYSPVRTVSFTAIVKAEISVYPNPATSATGATLDLTALQAGTYQAELFDMAGRNLGTYRVAGGQRHPLAVEALPSGSYLVRVTGSIQTFITKLVKE